MSCDFMEMVLGMKYCKRGISFFLTCHMSLCKATARLGKRLRKGVLRRGYLGCVIFVDRQLGACQFLHDLQRQMEADLLHRCPNAVV